MESEAEKIEEFYDETLAKHINNCQKDSSDEN